MSVSVLLADSESEDGPYELCSASDWAEFCEWAERTEFAELKTLCNEGAVENTFLVAQQLRDALELHECEENVEEIALELIKVIGVGADDETITTVE